MNLDGRVGKGLWLEAEEEGEGKKGRSRTGEKLSIILFQFSQMSAEGANWFYFSLIPSAMEIIFVAESKEKVAESSRTAEESCDWLCVSQKSCTLKENPIAFFIH